VWSQLTLWKGQQQRQVFLGLVWGWPCAPHTPPVTQKDQKGQLVVT